MAKADMFLRLEGKSTGAIKGEAVDDRHGGDIEIQSWSWGMRAGSAITGAGAAGRVAMHELAVTKGVDSASTALMSVMRNNEQIKKAVLTVRKSGGSPVDYLTVTLERARITSFEVLTAEPGKPDLVERLSIAFEKISVDYATQMSSGQKNASSSFIAEVTLN